MKGGRPLWFLLAVIGGWGMFRGIALYREYRDWYRDGAIRPPKVPIAAAPSWPRARAMPLLVGVPSNRVRYEAVPRPYGRPARTAPPTFVTVGHLPGAATPPAAILPTPDAARAPAAAPPAILTSWPRRSRLAGSAWLIARDGAAADIPGSQLGGSQAGIRLTYAIGADRGLALSARVSAPLSGPGREVAIGLDWQPIRVPLHIVAERRVALNGGRGGMMAGVVGGFGPREMIAGVRVEGYAQAGVVLRGRADAFADGAMRASLPLARIGGLRIDGGGGLWGGVQRGAGRLDVGPSLGLTLPLGTRTLRLAADWRQRIAGPSRPDSGPALSIGTDF